MRRPLGLGMRSGPEWQLCSQPGSCAAQHPPSLPTTVLEWVTQAPVVAALAELGMVALTHRDHDPSKLMGPGIALEACWRKSFWFVYLFFEALPSVPPWP